MAYAAVQDMIERFTEQEVRQLAPSAGAPGYDLARVEQVLADASAELDSFLAVRFAVPLTTVPALVVKFTCDLAREALDRTGRAHVLEAGKRARAWARDVAQGRASLGSGPADDPTATPEAEAGGARIIAGRRVFDDDGLAGYLG